MATEAPEDPRVLPAWWGAGEGACSEADMLAHVREALGDDISTARIEPWLASGGNAGDMFRLIIRREGSDADEVVCTKFTKPDASTSIANGLAREAFFLSNLPDELVPLIPRILFAAGNMVTGRKVTATELIDGVQSGYFFGAHSPLNHGKDLAAITSDFSDVTEEDVCLRTARMAATLHASKWNDPSLKVADPPTHIEVLRARNWLLHGTDKESWEGAMGFARTAWESAKAKAPEEREGLVLDEKITALLDAAFTKATWEELQAGMATRDLTLVHGDFHPANMVVTKADKDSDEKFQLMLLDWEVVGIGCGVQDLGQYMLSHSSPESRRAVEPKLLSTYRETLNSLLEAAGKPGLSEETVKERYVQGGLGRFAWMAAVIMHLCPPGFAMYFVNQVVTFADDHGITPETMPAARA